MLFMFQGLSMESNNKTLLVIDDDEENCELLKRMFEKRGFKVKVAADGQEGLMALALNDVNLIFLDLNMPLMNGFTFLEKVKMNKNHREIPVFVTSSLDDEDTINDCLSYGANGFIPKPYDMDKMLECIKSCLDDK